MPVPDPLSSLAEPLTDGSPKDDRSSSSDGEDEDVEVVAEVVRANAPTEGITFNGSIHYRDDLNHSHSQVSRGRGLSLWKRPTIPREPSPVEIVYEMEHRKRSSHSSVRKSSSPAKSSTSTSHRHGSETRINDTRTRSGSVSSIGEESSKVGNTSSSDSRKTTYNTQKDTITNPETTQPKSILKTMSKPTSTAPDTGKPPTRVQDEAPRTPHPFTSKPEIGPARRPSSFAPTRVPEGGNRVSASQGQSSTPVIENILRPPTQTAPKAAATQPQNIQSRHPQPQPQAHNPSSSISSQPSSRTSSQSAPGPDQGQHHTATQVPRPSSVFKPPNPPPRQPSSQAPPAHVHRETRIPPPIVGRNISNAPSRLSFQSAPQPTSGQVNGPQPGPQQSYPTSNVAKAPLLPIRPVVQPIRSGLLLSQPTPSRLPQQQPSTSDIPQPLGSTTLPPQQGSRPPPQPQSRPQPQPQMSTFQSATQHQVSTSVVSISSGASQSPTPQPPEPPNLTVEDIESKLEAFNAALGDDHARYVEYLLDEAEQMAPEPRHLSDFDAFADMPALSNPATSSDTASALDKGAETMAFKLKVHHGDNGKPKAPTKSFDLPVVKIKTDKEAVPKYRFHHTEIKKNILVPNTMLLFVPHLRDVDPNSEQEREYINWLNELDKLDKDSGFKTENRKEKFHKRIRDEIAATLSMYIEPWLRQLGIDGVCSRSHLIRYMVSQEENREHITQQLKDAILSTCKDNTDLTPEAVEAARMFTLAFNNVFGNNNTDPERAITLRDVLLLEKRETVVDEKRAKVDSQTAPPAHLEEDDELDKNELVTRVEASLSSYAVLGCNICFTHDCEHGDIDVHNYHRTFSLDTIGGVVRALKRKWTNQVASMGSDEEAVATASKKAPQHLPCQNACYRRYDIGPAAAPVTAWADSEVSVLEDMFFCVGHSQTLKAQCIVASILERKCWEVYRKIKELGLVLPHVSPPQPKPAKVKPLPWYDRRKKCLMGDWSDQTSSHEFSIREIIDPCFHDGPCTKENPACPCANASPRPQLCDRFCHCTVEDCALKFTGCACHSTGKTCIQRQKEGKPCICIMLNRECDPVVCKGCGAKERADPDNAHDEALHSTGCQNVSLQRGVSKTVLLGKSQLEGCGYGLFTAEDISQDEFVIEYTGELISHDEGVRREARRGEGLQGTSSYLFTLLEHEGIWVDAAMYGNLSRYINHASESDKKTCNITPKIVFVNNEYRIKFTALRDIKAGEELFFNYGDNFPNLTKKLLQDQDDDGETATTTKRGKKGRPAGTTSALTQGTARKATTKASTTAKGKAISKRGARKTAASVLMVDVPPSDDYEDETWIKDPSSVPLYEDYEDDDDEDSYYPSGKKRKRRGGRRPGAGRKKKTPNPEEEADQGSATEGGEMGAVEDGNGGGEAGGKGGQQPRTLRGQAVSEISDSQAERDDAEVFSSESEDSDAPLSPSRIVTRRRRALRTTTTTNATSAVAVATTSRATSRSASVSAYTTAASSSGSTPAPSQPGDGSGDGSGDGGGDGAAEVTEEQGQAKKRSNRGGTRPGAGRKPRKMLRLAKSGSASASASASETTSAGVRQWDRLKAGIAGGGGSGSGSGSGSATAGPSGLKRKADQANVHSMENSSTSGSEVEQSEASQVSKRRTPSPAASQATRHTTRPSRTAAATAATKALVSPATMKTKPSGVTVTRSPGGSTAAHALRAHHHYTPSTASVLNAAAQAQIRAEELLRAASAAQQSRLQAQRAQQVQQGQMQGLQVQGQQGQELEIEQMERSGLYHTAANFQPFTSDNSEDDEEDVASGEEDENEEDEEGQVGEGSGLDEEDEEDEDEGNGGDVGEDEDAENGDDEVDDEADEEVDEEEEFDGFDSEPGAASGAASESVDDGEGDGDPEDEESDDEDENDQSPVPSKGLRPRRPPAPSLSTKAASGAPVVGGKVLRQRSNQPQSQSQSQSQATSHGKMTRKSSSTTSRDKKPGTERMTTGRTTTATSSTGGKASTGTNKPTSQPKPKSSSSKGTRPPPASAVNIDKRSLRGHAPGSKDSRESRGSKRSRGETEEGSRKRQKPLRYRNEEE